MKILHVIERLSRGGASRALIAMAKYVGRLGSFRQAVSSLSPSDALARRMAREAGLDVLDADPTLEREQLAAADIVHVHFWNTPDLYAWLRRGVPQARVVLTQHVSGEHPAQVMTRAVRDFADHIVLASAYSLRLPVYAEWSAAERERRLSVVLQGADFARLAGSQPQAHHRFRIGYVGTVGFVKMHPRFVELSAAAKIVDVCFVVCGDGDERRALEARARALGASDRFEWLEPTEDVGAVFAALDVLGYPLRHDTYAAAELVVQEAMFCGVAPVLMRTGAPALLVEHGETGLLADGDEDYTAALERLAGDGSLRRRLSAGARRWARSQAGAENAAPALAAVYAEMMSRPRRDHVWQQSPALSPHRGANAFLESLGDAAEPFRSSLLAADGAARNAADDEIARLSPVATGASSGGVVHYRRFYPDDPFLCFWSGLALAHQGRRALAAGEIKRAETLGLEGGRARDHLDRILSE